MSRIGLKPIELPEGVEVNLLDENVVEIKGPKGTLKQKMVQELTIKKEESSIIVERPSDSRQHKSLHGLTRSLIDSMVVGVTQGYTKKLEIVGVGYKAEKKGNKLVLNLGYSHPVEMEDPNGIETSVEKNMITVTGIDKQKVGNYAAVIRDWRKPEPYKGKGIKYEGEHIRRKAGKTAG
ncbi:MAG: 50S ribosomal protein L6 [Bacillota bacterium]|nr:50S ribosomal protein L6 [Bacillota bacterium]